MKALHEKVDGIFGYRQMTLHMNRKFEEKLNHTNMISRLFCLNTEAFRDIEMLDGKTDKTKQSILSKAFRGELCTNDPTEESAIELLKEVLQEQVK